MKICVISGSRAEFGLLRPLIKRIDNSINHELQLVISGSHLSKFHGFTKEEIEKSGIIISYEVELGLSNSDDPLSIAKALSKSIYGFAQAFNQLSPEIVLILGDRYESFAAAQSAMLLNIPIGHIHGGELTEGLIDEAMRHSITKMSHVHFVAAHEYRERVIQLGENPDRVHLVGPLGLPNIDNLEKLTNNQLEKKINFCLENKFIMITYHPETLASDKLCGIKNLLDALDKLQGYSQIFSGGNADTYSRKITDQIRLYCRKNPENRFFKESFGNHTYLNLIHNAAAVVGNSSSGIIEAPLVGTPTLNVGNRQNGRLKAPSIVNCDDSVESISHGLEKVLSKQYASIGLAKKSPYKIFDADKKIINLLDSLSIEGLIVKRFYDAG